MTKRMLIEATHPEETRVVVLDGNRLEDFDIETAHRRPLKGNIYLAKVVRVEPSLQAAFVEYGGNRHGFLAFGEIHPDYYQIPVADRQRLLEMQAEEARAEADEDEDPLPESASDRMRWNGDESEPAGDDAPGASSGEPANGAAPDQAEPAADAARMPDALTDAPTDATATEQAAPAAAQPLAMAEDRVQAPAADSEAAEATDANGIDSTAEHGRVESIAAEDVAPPETIGGEGPSGDGDAEEDRRERRPPPRFMRHYKIQEVIKRRQIMLVQVVKEERGNKGAALTTFVSLAGRFSVLMPNSPRGGGISRKITSAADRKRLREVFDELNLPGGMSLIVRTAGANRPKPEIKRDCEYLLRLWDSIRERTLSSTAPALIYEEADLIKRSIRDTYGRDIEEIVVDGEDAYSEAREFMRMLMPSHLGKIRLHRDGPLFARTGVDAHLEAMHSPTVQLRSGGYIVINQTEALVAIDVNSGRATRDRHIEDTAYKVNLEAADEIARQVRLRDLAGLIVIDFIDMESNKHDAMVERRLKDALKQDRARIQVGRISHFGLLEMSRQRLRPSYIEHSFIACPHCQGRGEVRSVESAALSVLRAIDEEGAKRRSAEIVVHAATPLALWLLNRKRDRLMQIEERSGLVVTFQPDDSLVPPAHRIERLRAATAESLSGAPSALRMDFAPEVSRDVSRERAPALDEPAEEMDAAEADFAEPGDAAAREDGEGRSPAGEARPQGPRGEPRGESEEDANRRRRRRRRRGGRREDGAPVPGQERAASEGGESGEDDESTEAAEPMEAADAEADARPDGAPDAAPGGEDEEARARRRRRGRRGGGRRREEEGAPGAAPSLAEPVIAQSPPSPPPAPRYAGPTPADPFAGHIDDIFDAMEAAEAAAEREAMVPRAPRVVAAPPPPAEPAERVTALADLPVVAEQSAMPVANVAAPEPEPVVAVPPAPPPAPPPVAVTQAAPPEPVAAPPIEPVVLGEGAEIARPRRQGWWKR